MEQLGLNIEEFTPIRISEFKDYLDTFKSEQNISLVVVNSKTRKVLEGKINLLSDIPAIMFDVINEKDFDEI